MNSRFRSESGQTMAEYAVTLGVITVALVLAFAGLGGAAADKIVRVLSAIG